MSPTQGDPQRPRSENSSPRHEKKANSSSSSTGTIPKLRPSPNLFPSGEVEGPDVLVPPPQVPLPRPTELLGRIRDHRDQIGLMQQRVVVNQIPAPAEISDQLQLLQQRLSLLHPFDVNNGYEGEDDETEEDQARGRRHSEANREEIIEKLRQLELRKMQMEAVVREQEAQKRQNMPFRPVPRNDADLNELKGKLVELQTVVNFLEGRMDPTSPEQFQKKAKKKTSSTRLQPMNTTDHLMAEMQEQLKMQKELHLRRKELEDLMKKDFLDNLRKSEEESRHNYSDTKSDDSSSLRSHPPGWCFLPEMDQQSSEGDGYLMPGHLASSNDRSRQLSFSSNRSQNKAAQAKINGNIGISCKQLETLQSQIENLHMDIRRINAPSQAAQQDNQYFQFLVQHQQQQIHQLANSVNHCFQTVNSIQRDLGNLQRSVEKLASRPTMTTSSNLQSNSNSSNNNNNSNMNIDNNNAHLPEQAAREFNPWPDTTDFSTRLIGALESTPSLWLTPQINPNPPQSSEAHPWVNNVALQQQQHQNFSGLELNNPSHNNSVQGALNNQVPPGIRANNYWDNFRSFSRQNRLSCHATPPLSSSTTLTAALATMTSSTSTATGSQAPNVAQVIPRQLQLSVAVANDNQSIAVPVSFALQPTQSDVPSSASARQAYIEPNFSSLTSTRPRRKQKINREQNRESTLDSHQLHSNTAAAAMVFPMPQQENSRNVNRSQSASAQPQMNLATVNPIARSLTRSIYNQVNNLVSQHEEQPDQLAMIFQDLQSLDARLIPSGTETDTPAHPQDTLNSFRRPESDDSGTASGSLFQFGLNGRADSQPMNNCTPKVKKEKRFSAFTRSPKSSKTTSCNVSRLLSARSSSENDDRSTLFSIHNSLGEMTSLLQGAVGGAVGNTYEANQSEDQPSSSLSIPKNIQRNLTKPKNMQNNVSDDLSCMPETDMAMTAASTNQQATQSSEEDEFIDVHIQFDQRMKERNIPAIPPISLDAAENEAGAQEEDESEMAEADQDHSPDQSFSNADEPSSSNLSQLEQQRQEEEEQNLRSLVEEVLRSTDDEEESVLPPCHDMVNGKK